MLGIIATILIFVILLGGIASLLKNKDFKIPKDYDPSKSGYDDEEDEDDRSGF